MFGFLLILHTNNLAAINGHISMAERDAQDTPDIMPWVEMGNKYGFLSKTKMCTLHVYNLIVCILFQLVIILYDFGKIS